MSRYYLINNHEYLCGPLSEKEIRDKPNTSCYDYYTFQDLEEACIRAKTLSLTEFPVSLLYEPIETEHGWRMKEIFIYMKGRAIASERIRLHCSFYLRAGHKLN